MESQERVAFLIENEEAGERIDAVLAGLVEDLSRNGIQRLIEKGNVSVNGLVITQKKLKLKEHDEVTVLIDEAIPMEAKAQDIPIDIIYEDEDVLVVNKAKGMVVHPAIGNAEGTLVNAILWHCGDRLSSINGVLRPGIVHRIDKDTSGLLMVAKNDKAHRSLSEQLAAHSITRVYEAVVYHNLMQDQGTIDAPIGRDPKNRLRMAVTAQNSKKAVTHYHVLERFGSFTRIEAILETGRTHQIRVHMTYIKHPLLGDALYGPKKNNYGVEGQVLHAKKLGFEHPSGRGYMEFESPLPPEFEMILEKMRK
ncbi:MAG: RluA family pseudouridine synthase [Eubacteriales bacterium]|nr:RluA family pseudouridine synthase [Eubacteriales bacterium]MDD3349896.1 RluA family pseudouridine synthase [Eubacteriales bacterium]